MNDFSESMFPWMKWPQAMLEEGLAHGRRFASLPSFWEKAQRVRKGVTPSEVVYEEDRLRVLHYASPKPKAYRIPLVFIYALVNRPYILDLKVGRSVVAQFVERGFDTYLVDWGVPTHADRHLTLEDYINGYMPNVVEHVCERTGSPQINMLGYCMGGTMSAMYAALHPAKLRNLILLAAPIDFSTRSGLLNVWSQEEYFDVDKFVDVIGNCPPEFLQSLFLLLKPVQNLIEKPINLYENLDNEKYIDDFITTETWLTDNIPVPGEVYRIFVKYLYQKNLLIQNKLPVGRHIVNLQNITCPVLNIMAAKDDLVPCEQSSPFNDAVGSRERKTLLLSGAGHIGLAIGGRAQKELWPEACAWLGPRSEPIGAKAEAN